MGISSFKHTHHKSKPIKYLDRWNIKAYIPCFPPIQKCQTVRQISNQDKCQNVGSASHHFFVADANFTEVDECLKSQTALRKCLDQGHRGRRANPTPSKQQTGGYRYLALSRTSLWLENRRVSVQKFPADLLPNKP